MIAAWTTTRAEAEVRPPLPAFQAPRANARRLRWLCAILLAVAVLVTYAPALRNGFVSWDDNAYVTENPRVLHPSWENAVWAFSAVHGSNWHPLTWLSHMFDVALFGPAPWGHHLTSIVLHAANAVLLFLVLTRMTRNAAPSLFVAALFALHPVQVESVAWVAERKNVLSTLFWILTMWAYTRYVEAPGRKRYAAVAVCFALGLMSKPMLVTLPFVLLLLDAWPLGRLTRATLLARLAEKAPLFAMSAASCWITLLAQRPSRMSMTAMALGDRVLNALVSYARYLLTAVVPSRLSPYYSIPGSVEAAPIPIAGVALAALAVVGLTLLAIRLRTRAPHVIVGWLWYLGTLVPVIGLVQVGGQAAADRYAYVPLIGVFIAFAWSLPTPRRRAVRVAAGAVALGVLALCGLRAAAQVGVWRDSGTLWRRVLEFNPRCRPALTNYGIWLVQSGESERGVAMFRSAIAVDSLFHHARISLGGALTKLGRSEEAIRELEFVAARDTHLREAPFNLGVALSRVGRRAEARAALEAALALDPRYADAHAQLASMLIDDGFVAEAVSHCRAALESVPNHAAARTNLAVALAASGDRESARAMYGALLRERPRDADVHYNLAQMLAGEGRLAEAIGHYREAASIDTLRFDARSSLAVVLSQNGDLDGALAAGLDAIRLRPDNADAHYNLGLIHLRRRESPEALREFEEAARLRPTFGEAYVNQGAVLAGMGRHEEAIARYRESLRVQPANVQGHSNLAFLLLRLQMRGDAVAALRAGLTVAPGNAAMGSALAWLLATAPESELRRGDEAVALAERTVAATGRRDSQALDALGAAYAETRRFGDALRAAEEALALASASGDTASTAAIRDRIALYERERPYRATR